MEEIQSNVSAAELAVKEARKAFIDLCDEFDDASMTPHLSELSCAIAKAEIAIFLLRCNVNEEMQYQ